MKEPAALSILLIVIFKVTAPVPVSFCPRRRPRLPAPILPTPKLLREIKWFPAMLLNVKVVFVFYFTFVLTCIQAFRKKRLLEFELYPLYVFLSDTVTHSLTVSPSPQQRGGNFHWSTHGLTVGGGWGGRDERIWNYEVSLNLFEDRKQIHLNLSS